MNKNFYNIDDVSQLVGEKKHTIRFWESRIKKLKVMTRVELNNLEKKEKFDLKNHAGRNIGHISLTMK